MKRYNRKSLLFLTISGFCAMISVVFAVWGQFVKGQLLDNAVAGAALSTFWSGALLGLLILLETGFFYGNAHFSARFRADCMGKLKEDIFKSVLKRDYPVFRSRAQGEYLAIYTNQAEQFDELLFSVLPELSYVLFRVLLVAGGLFLLDWQLALVTLILLTTPLYLPKLLEKKLQTAQGEYVRAVERNLTRVTDWLKGFEVLKNFSAERRIFARFEQLNAETMAKFFRKLELSNRMRLMTTLISYLSYFIIMGVSAWLVIAGRFTAGDFFVAIGMIDQLSYPLISLSQLLQCLFSIREEDAKLESFLAEPGSAQRAGDFPARFEREIEYDKVNFSYVLSRPILKGFSLTIEKGKRYLLCGPSGCGKTSVTNLLLRYYSVSGGEIRMDGKPIEMLADLYSAVTVVRQEPILFRETLRDNLTMGDVHSDEELIALLKRLGLSQFANTDSLDRVLADGGSDLSGGERKRICLARALLRKSELLILDEPLANLDAENADIVEKEILSVDNRTLLVVSHQFSAENASRFDHVIRMEAASCT